MVHLLRRSSAGPRRRGSHERVRLRRGGPVRLSKRAKIALCLVDQISTTTKRRIVSFGREGRGAHADRTGLRALVTGRATGFVRSQTTHALLRSRCRRAAQGVGWTLSLRMDSCGVQLRHEQSRQLCLCRHAAATTRHSPASNPHVKLLGRRSASFRKLAACACRVALDEAVRQQYYCCCTIETVLSRVVSRGHGSGVPI